MSPLKHIAAFSVCIVSFSAVAEVPVIFQSGTPARAAEVNQNFAALDARVGVLEEGIPFTTVYAEDAGVAIASCPVGTIAASASCLCDYDNGTRNFGVLFACITDPSLSGGGGGAGCFPEGRTFNPALPDPLASVEVFCVAGVPGGAQLAKTVPSRPLEGQSESSYEQVPSDKEPGSHRDLSLFLKSSLDKVGDYKSRLGAAKK